MSTPIFTIIIPVYNAAKTLNKCLQSILYQDFKYFEVICVDDGSTDSSWSQLEVFQIEDSRIRCLKQSNSGPLVARNRALKEATGSYILFIDSDDYLYSNNALSILYDTLVSNSNSDIIYFAGSFVTSSDIFLDNSKQRKEFQFGYQCMEEYCLSKTGLVFGSVSQQCISRDLIESYSIRFNEHIVYGEDRLFICTAFLFARKTIVIPNVLYCYVIDNSCSLTKDQDRLPRASLDIIKVATQLDFLIKGSKYKQPKFRKYIHGLYIDGVRKSNKKTIDWSLVFRNSSTLRLFIKDVLFYLGLYNYT